MTQQEKEQFREEMIEELRQEEIRERRLRSDFDYAWSRIEPDNLQIAIKTILDFKHNMELYGWELSYEDIIEA